MPNSGYNISRSRYRGVVFGYFGSIRLVYFGSLELGYSTEVQGRYLLNRITAKSRAIEEKS